MAQVDVQAGPFRVVSLISREAADELGLEVGSPRGREREGDERQRDARSAGRGRTAPPPATGNEQRQPPMTDTERRPMTTLRRTRACPPPAPPSPSPPARSALLVLSACSPGGAGDDPTASDTAVASPTAAPTGEITVLAAASLTETFDGPGGRLRGGEPRHDRHRQLRRQLRARPADRRRVARRRLLQRQRRRP